jgi:hypothetical protein
MTLGNCSEISSQLFFYEAAADKERLRMYGYVDDRMLDHITSPDVAQRCGYIKIPGIRVTLKTAACARNCCSRFFSNFVRGCVKLNGKITLAHSN